MTKKEIMLHMLNDVVEQFGKNPYSRSLAKNRQLCSYMSANPDISPGCAIGIYISNSVAKKLDKLKETNIRDIMLSEHKKLLPKWMQNININFLKHLQFLHDHNSNFTNCGFSEEGLNKVNEIKNNIRTNKYK